MAGLYPNVPSRRMAVDDDGSLLIKKTGSNPPIELSQANKDELNDEDNVSVFQGNNQVIVLGWFFPEVREIDGFFLAFNRSSNGVYDIRTSVDTTNTIDGTHVTQISNHPEGTGVWPTQYRDAITSAAWSSIRFVNWRTTDQQNDQLTAFHIYGEISPGETPDRLLYIDELTGLEFALPIDYAEIPRGSSEDLEFRIKNNSALETATTIQYTAEDGYLGSGSWYTYTLPAGSTYAATQQIVSLAATITTGLIKIRRITPGGEDLGLHAGRTYLNVASWA